MRLVFIENSLSEHVGKEFLLLALIDYTYTIVIVSSTLHPLHRSLAIKSLHGFVHRTLLGVGVSQPAFLQQTFQVAGSGGWGEVTKLLEASAGEVGIRLEEVDEQGIYFVDVQRGRTVLVLRAFELRLFDQVLFQGGVGTEINRLDADVLPVHVRRGDFFGGGQGQPEIADALQIHVVAVAQMENQLVVQLGHDRLDVAHGQGASLVDVSGDFLRVDGCTVGHPCMVGGLFLASGCRRRRIDVEFNSHISKVVFVSSPR